MDIKISATCVMVPVFACYSQSINIEFDTNVEIDDINSLIDFKQIVKKPIIIGKNLKLPEEIENQIDSTILIYDWYIE